MSLTSPFKMPPWMPAPMATTSSGLISRLGSRPKMRLTVEMTIGLRVCPPTSSTSSIWSGRRRACWRASRQGSSVFSTRSPTSSSNFERDSVRDRWRGPEASAEMKGRLIGACSLEETSHLARSAASLSRCSAMRSLRRSTPVSPRNSSISQSMMRWSKSSPPR